MWQDIQPILASLLLILTLPTTILVTGLPQDLPPLAKVEEDTGQVRIKGDPTGNTTTTPNLPIRATIFSGSPGPKSCRGSVLLAVDVPPPNGELTTALCYNMPAPAGCGNFVANKDDGCEARLFAEPNCVLYMNTAVFIPENRAVGGAWRSVSVQCGITPPDPATLGKPPMQDLMQNANVRRPAKPAGR
ncbi:hypothetical protein B0T22DRAFT_279660 [Podospora appendiculata]|uniref:Uncharacterized protein n=1 Tax=Podospora appendiculata TaxID=314037 RepID=A0AAE1C7Y9_9PEZI|nr:hypothetical protein B0T22DRAFT_279660 [Podospora appendiculata]